MRQFIFCLLLVSAFAQPALAAKQKVAKPHEKSTTKTTDKSTDKIVETDPDAFPVLQQIKGTNKQLAYDYLGKRFGMDAWLLTGPNVMQIVYTSKGTPGAIIGGALVGEDGKEVSSELTKDFMSQYPERAQEILAVVKSAPVADKDEKTAAPAPSPAEALWQKLEQGGKITFGTNKDAPVIFAVLDPAQPATKEVWTHLGSIAKANKINLNVLPLSIKNTNGVMQIASILGDKSPATAWENLMHDKPIAKKEDAPADSSGVMGMKANDDLAQSFNLQELPFLVYREKSGKIRVVKGLPKDWNTLLKELNAL